MGHVRRRSSSLKRRRSIIQQKLKPKTEAAKTEAETETETETETEFEMEMEKFCGISAACHFVSLSHHKRRCLPTN